MRVSLLATAPLLLGFVASPAAAQVSARVRVGVGRRAPMVVARPRTQLVIDAYAPTLFGDWEDYYDDWQPVTVYYYDGAYYDYPIVDYATPVYVYRYNDRLFFPPRDRDFVTFRANPRLYRESHPRYPVRGYANGRTYRDVRPSEGRAVRPIDRTHNIAPAPRGGHYGERAPTPGHSGAGYGGAISHDRGGSHSAPHGGSRPGSRGGRSGH